MKPQFLSGMFTFPIRVYYEDTDAGGVVYYANYLKFLERCRSECLRRLGFEQSVLLRDQCIAFVVRSISMEYLKPARLDDLLMVNLEIGEISRSQILFFQQIQRDDEILASGTVQLVCVRIGPEGPVKIVSIPKTLRSQLEDIR